MLGENNINESMVFIARETGWTLEYIRNLPLKTVRTLVNEIAYQKRVDEYKEAYNFAMVICALVSNREHPVMPIDIVGEPPKRTKDNEIREEPEDIWTLAQREGIQPPPIT